MNQPPPHVRHSINTPGCHWKLGPASPMMPRRPQTGVSKMTGLVMERARRTVEGDSPGSVLPDSVPAAQTCDTRNETCLRA